VTLWAICSTRSPWQVTIDDRSSCTCTDAISDRSEACTQLHYYTTYGPSGYALTDRPTGIPS
jgi:hypothetical protein